MRPIKKLSDSEAARFKSKFEAKAGGCWNWTAHKNKSGYGKIRLGKDVLLAPRVSFSFFNGDIPEDFNVLHRCDNPACVNPDHLFLGTQRDNIDDMVSKGRRRTAIGENSPHAKLNSKKVSLIRYLFSSGQKSLNNLAEQFRVSKGAITSVCYRKTWKHIS